MVLCVTTAGMYLMPEWYADNWDTTTVVSICTCMYAAHRVLVLYSEMYTFVDISIAVFIFKLLC